MMYFLLVVSILLIVMILLQQKESSLGSMAGMDTGQEIMQSRRGAEKVLHNLTVGLSAILIVGGFYMMFVGS